MCEIHDLAICTVHFHSSDWLTSRAWQWLWTYLSGSSERGLLRLRSGFLTYDLSGIAELVSKYVVVEKYNIRVGSSLCMSYSCSVSILSRDARKKTLILLSSYLQDYSHRFPALFLTIIDARDNTVVSLSCYPKDYLYCLSILCLILRDTRDNCSLIVVLSSGLFASSFVFVSATKRHQT